MFVCAGVLRIQRDRLVQIVDRPLILAQAVVRRPAVQVGGRPVGIKLDGPVQSVDRSLVLAEPNQDPAPVLESFGVVGTEPG